MFHHQEQRALSVTCFLLVKVLFQRDAEYFLEVFFLEELFGQFWKMFVVSWQNKLLENYGFAKEN